MAEKIPPVALLLTTAPYDLAVSARAEIARAAPDLIRCPECGTLDFDHVKGCKTGEEWLAESYRRNP